MSELDPGEPTIASAAMRFKLIVLACFLGATGLAVVYAQSQPVQYKATAYLLLQDPRSALGSLGGQQPEAPDRYVGDQITLMTSPQVSNAAANLAANPPPAVTQCFVGLCGRLATPALHFSGDTFLANIAVTGSQTTIDVVQVSFTGPDDLSALIGANAVVTAYESVVHDEVQSAVTPLLSEIDTSLASVNSQVATLNTELIQSLPTSSQHQVQQLQLQSLLTQQGTLQANRQQLVLVLAHGNDGVANYGKATIAVKQSRLVTSLPIIGVAAVLGLLVGLGVAYVLARRQRVISANQEPEAILRAPLLADVPRLSRATAPLTSLRDLGASGDDPFRGAALQLQARHQPGSPLGVVAVAARSGQGNSTVVARIAFNLAVAGQRLLVIDLHSNHSQRRLLADAAIESPTDSAARDARLAGSVLFRNESPNLRGGSIAVLVTGDPEPVDMMAPRDFARRLDSVLSRLEAEADYVIVDAPPIVETGTSLELLRRYKWALAVIPSRSRVTVVVELAQMIEAVGLQPIGYVYNRLPRIRARSVSQPPAATAAPGATATSAA